MRRLFSRLFISIKINNHISMDCSAINMIDLKFLTNPLEMQKLNKDNDVFQIAPNDLAFYKKRIFQMAKNILQQKSTDMKVQNAFNAYCRVCIDYFKFIDKSEIIQTDYSHLKERKQQQPKNINLHTTNVIMMRKKKVRSPKITDHINIIRKKNTKKTIIPKKRSINLKDPKLQMKGVK
jgi:hypothetical protein